MSEQRGEGDLAGTSTTGGPTVIDVTPTPDAAPETEHPPEVPLTASDRRWVPITAFVALVLIVASSPYWAPPIASVLPWGSTPEPKLATVDTSAIEAKLGALETHVAELAQAHQRVAALEPRVAQLEQRSAPTSNPQAAQQAQAVTVLSDRITALEQRIATLAAAASSQTAADATKGLQTQVQALSEKLDQQSQLITSMQNQKPADASSGSTDAALVLTLGQLRAVLATTRPYAAELQAAEALAKDEPDILAGLRPLDGRAQQGIPTVAQLAAQFLAVTQSVTQASALAPAAEGWRARVIAKLESLVTIHRVGDAQGKVSPSGGLSDAESALKNGDLAAAVAIVRRAGEPATPALAAWLDDAQARIDAEAALSAVEATLMKQILAAPTAGAKP